MGVAVVAQLLGRCQAAEAVNRCCIAGDVTLNGRVGFGWDEGRGVRGRGAVVKAAAATLSSGFGAACGILLPSEASVQLPPSPWALQVRRLYGIGSGLSRIAREFIPTQGAACMSCCCGPSY